MRLKASWIVATHFRPALLMAALRSIRANGYPDGWDYEVMVVHSIRDRLAVPVVQQLQDEGLNVFSLSSRDVTGGGKRTAGLHATTGDLVLAADDDDIQSPLRASTAIAAYTAGHAISELREFRYLHLETGQVVRWCGNGEAGMGQVVCGTARNYRRTMLLKAGGWKSIPRLIEKDLQARLNARFPGRSSRAVSLAQWDRSLTDTTICLQHGENVWGDRPALAKGEIANRGAFQLVGEGHWRELANFPPEAARALGLS